jgi:protein required for attachment to host cells
MQTPFIVLADRARARFFSIRRIDVDGTETVDLVEQEDLVSPEHLLRDEQIYSSTKSGLRFPPTRRGRHTVTVDDHRDAHRREVDGKFAKSIVERMAELFDSARANELILVAEPRQLGFLRAAMEKWIPRDVQVIELSRDLTHLAADQIQAKLAGEGLLPPRVRLTVPRA